MKIEFLKENGIYKGTLHRHNGLSTLYANNRWDIIRSFVVSAHGKEKNFRVEEESWTSDDWARDFAETERSAQHKDDDKI